MSAKYSKYLVNNNHHDIDTDVPLQQQQQHLPPLGSQKSPPASKKHDKPITFASLSMDHHRYILDTSKKLNDIKKKKKPSGTNKPKKTLTSTISQATASNSLPSTFPLELSSCAPQWNRQNEPLSVMDERILILYHSTLRQNRMKADPAQQGSILMAKYGYEGSCAAVQIQKIIRGILTRKFLNGPNGPKFHQAARTIQFASRFYLVRQRIQRRVDFKLYANATRIQAWYRGWRCREFLLDEQARWINRQMLILQRRFRGKKFWRVVQAALNDRKKKACIQIQRVHRGHLGRQRVDQICEQQKIFCRHFAQVCRIHQQFARCENCNRDKCTEQSLFECFMARFIGLHDFKGAQQLAFDGFQLFPFSAKFYFLYGVLSQVLCEDFEIAMAFLKKAAALGITDKELEQCEKKYFTSALQIYPNDAACIFDLAVFLQSWGKNTRAEINYRKVLALTPLDYKIPGYLNRVNMVDRLLMNYHRFCSIFNGKIFQITTKNLPVIRREEKVRVTVSKQNHYTSISPTEVQDQCRFNAIYLNEQELGLLLEEQREKIEAQKQNDQDMAYVPPTTSTTRAQRSKSIKIGTVDLDELAAKTVVRKNAVVEVHQNGVRSLLQRPYDLTANSLEKSKVKLTKDQVERILRDVMFVPPINTHISSFPSPPLTTSNPSTPEYQTTVRLSTPKTDNSGSTTQDGGNFLYRVMILPSVLKYRQQQRLSHKILYSVLDIQRVFRGFLLRSRLVRDQILADIQQKQRQKLYEALERNYQYREHRRKNATIIQKIYRGYVIRQHFERLHYYATEIQRIYRGHRGKKRAQAFRDGSCTFYMPETVFQRGVEVGGQRMMLVIEKCGMTFRFYGFDIENCEEFQGLFSSESCFKLIGHLNWMYATRLLGKEFIYQGQKAVIDSVADINGEDGMVTVKCITHPSVENGTRRKSTIHFLMTLADCISTINLRAFSSEPLEMPLTEKDTPRIITEIVSRLVLVKSFKIATHELKNKTTSSSLMLAVQPPNGAHMFFHKKESLDDTRLRTRRRSFATSSILLLPKADQLREKVAFPAVDGLRGISIGSKSGYRKKCHKHFTRYTRCHCTLPIVTAAAHVEAISLALAHPHLQR